MYWDANLSLGSLPFKGSDVTAGGRVRVERGLACGEECGGGWVGA